MEIKHFQTLHEALTGTCKKDAEYILISHSLTQKRIIRRHYHPHANEYIILTHGEFDVTVGKIKKSFRVMEGVTVIKFPKRHGHAFLARSNLSYFVLRDRMDETVYCE